MKSILGLRDMPRDEILEILTLADQFVTDADALQTPDKYRQSLAGSAVALMFFEPSTRTRASFELAVTRLGGHAMVFTHDASSMKKGESELDTCRNLTAMGVDAFVIRHSERRVPLTIADHIPRPVFNAGNGSGEHPTQGLLDLMTIRRTLGRDNFEGTRVAIIGDIVHSRVARSDVYGLRALGASVTVAGPPKLLPTDRAEWEVDFASSRADALKDADFVIMLRVQRERMHTDAIDAHDYVRQWGVDEVVVETEMKRGAWIMHPGPVMRGTELSSRVADSDRSLILKQTAFGVATRQAVLLHAMERT